MVEGRQRVLGLRAGAREGLRRGLEVVRVERVEGAGSQLVEATVKLTVKGNTCLHAAEGNGPVDALSQALQLALADAFPELVDLHLSDYKVRVVNSADGSAAKVRVLIEHVFRGEPVMTLGVSENIIEASWQALVDGVDYAVHRATLVT